MGCYQPPIPGTNGGPGGYTAPAGVTATNSDTYVNVYHDNIISVSYSTIMSTAVVSTSSTTAITTVTSTSASSATSVATASPVASLTPVTWRTNVTGWSFYGCYMEADDTYNVPGTGDIVIRANDGSITGYPTLTNNPSSGLPSSQTFMTVDFCLTYCQQNHMNWAVLKLGS